MSKVPKPFELSHFLEAVHDASQRSRGILLIIIFSSLLVFIALVNSLKPQWGWYNSRLQLQSDVATYISFPKERMEEDRALSQKDVKGKYCQSISEFAKINEERLNAQDTLSKEDLTLLSQLKEEKPQSEYRYVSPKITPILSNDKDKRMLRYTQIFRAFDYASSRNLRRKDAVYDDLNEYLEAKLEHISLVRVPILGISFDINLLGVYGGFALSGLCLLLYYSFVREHRNLKILFRRGWEDERFHNYYFYEYISMFQVLSVPQKLFVTNNKFDKVIRWFPYTGFFMPVFVQSAVTSYDFISKENGMAFNPTLTAITLIVDSLLLAIILFLVIRILIRVRRIDRLWDVQASQFNLEFIFENLGVDKKVDFNNFENRLFPDDLLKVKRFWFVTLREIIDSHENLKSRKLEKKVRNSINSFVEDCLTRNFELSPYVLQNIKGENIDDYWKMFVDWFEDKGKLKISYEFHLSFIDDYVSKIIKRNISNG